MADVCCYDTDYCLHDIKDTHDQAVEATRRQTHLNIVAMLEEHIADTDPSDPNLQGLEVAVALVSTSFKGENK